MNVNTLGVILAVALASAVTIGGLFYTLIITRQRGMALWHTLEKLARENGIAEKDDPSRQNIKRHAETLSLCQEFHRATKMHPVIFLRLVDLFPSGDSTTISPMDWKYLKDELTRDPGDLFNKTSDILISVIEAFESFENEKRM